MDTFIEKIVHKQKDIIDYLKILAIFIGGLTVIMASFYFLGQAFLCTIVIILAGYGGWFLITSTNTEFEYSFTNNFMDVDKIIAQRKRKRVVSLDIKDFDVFAKATDENIAKYNSNNSFKKVYVSTNKKNDELYFVVYKDKETGKAMLFFEPDDRMIEVIKKYIPQKVAL
ncbi:MAG: hypothetical protein RR436_00195 [Clostridia bacterium]